MTGPSYHARTHLPGGTDPLPLTTTDWLALSISRPGLASNTVQSSVDISAGTAHWDTSDSLGSPGSSAIFGLADGGGGFSSIEIKQNGLYLFMIEALFTLPAGTVAAAGSIAEVGLTGNNYQVGGGDHDLWVANLAASQYGSQPARIAFSSLPAASFTPPIYKSVTVGQNSGFTTQGYTLDVLVLKLESDGSENL